MDVAYDHVQEEALSPSEEAARQERANENASNINAEFVQAFRAVSSSPWGSRLGGWFSQARKQGESLYNDLSKEAVEAQEQATKGFTQLREQVARRTRGLSLNAEPGPENQVPGEEGVPFAGQPQDESSRSNDQVQAGAKSPEETPQSLPADIVKEAGSLVASLRSTAAARLKDLQSAEDAADEALLRFGSNVRTFLRDAVSIRAPSTDSNTTGEVLFETSEPGTGKKVFHTTRLQAQLHAIHTTPSSFTEDPQGEQWEEWQKTFDVEKQTDTVAEDLEKYEELRRRMEKLVPEKVDYKSFWMRYYFLRKAVEAEETRRKEVLRKGAAGVDEEEVGWEDDDDDGDTVAPNVGSKLKNESTTTLNAPTSSRVEGPKTSSRSNEDENKSVADSDASYDMISGSNSRATGSPKEEKKKPEESDDDDWE